MRNHQRKHAGPFQSARAASHEVSNCGREHPDFPFPMLKIERKIPSPAYLTIFDQMQNLVLVGVEQRADAPNGQ